MSKIIEKIVVQRLEEHLNSFSLYDPLQSAYRSGHSTETTIVKLSTDIRIRIRIWKMENREMRRAGETGRAAEMGRAREMDSIKRIML